MTRRETIYRTRLLCSSGPWAATTHSPLRHSPEWVSSKRRQDDTSKQTNISDALWTYTTARALLNADCPSPVHSNAMRTCSILRVVLRKLANIVIDPNGSTHSWTGLRFDE